MIWDILHIVSLISNLLPLAGAIYFFRKLDKLQFKLFYYALYIVVAQIINSYIARVIKINTIWFFDIYLVIQIVYFIWFYNQWKKYSKVYLLYSLLFLFFIIVLEYFQYFVFSESYKGVSYTFPIIFIFFIIQSAVVILKTFDLSDTEFNKSFIFWIAFSNLIYFMAILPFNIYSYFSTELKGDAYLIYRYADGVVNHLANIALNCIIMFSFSCRKS